MASRSSEIRRSDPLPFIISKNVIAKLLIAMSPLASDTTKKIYAKNKTIQKRKKQKGKKKKLYECMA
jgi:hypothetical protein